jgi:hypothetical protein
MKNAINATVTPVLKALVYALVLPYGLWLTFCDWREDRAKRRGEDWADTGHV